MKKTNLVAYIANTKSRDCLMTVCPGSKEQREDMLRATLNAMRGNFDSVTIIMADSLDIWNMKRTINNEEEALEAAKKRGADWRKSYEKNIKEVFGSNYRFIYWDNVKADPSWKKKRSLMQSLYNQSFPVKKLFDRWVEDHTNSIYERMALKGLSIDKDLIHDLDLKYLLDEYTGISVVRSWTNAPEIYGGECLHDPHFFNKHNVINPSIDLTIPEVIPVKFEQKTLPQISLSA